MTVSARRRSNAPARAALPPSDLTVPRTTVDHDLRARLARGQHLLRRSVGGRPEVLALANEIAEWRRHTRDLITRRFVEPAVVSAYDDVADPLILPAPEAGLAAQVGLLRGQLEVQLAWLDQLQASLDDRAEPAWHHHDARRGRQHRPRQAAVLAVSASPVAAAVVGAVARATGMLPVVIEGQVGDRRSWLDAAERTLPGIAVGVVVVEAESPERIDDLDVRDTARHAAPRPSAGSLIALGYAAGALGPDAVIAVLAGAMDAPIVADFAHLVIGSSDKWRTELSGLLEHAGVDARADARERAARVSMSAAEAAEAAVRDGAAAIRRR